MYEYKAKVTGVVDGDTLDISIQLGFSIIYDLRVRLFGINTPEKTGSTKEAGLKATEFVKAAVLGKEVVVQTIKDKQEKFGRYLAVILYQTDTGELNLAKELIKAGLGVEYFGGKR